MKDVNYLTVKDIAAILKISRRQAQRVAIDCVHVRVGRQIRVPRRSSRDVVVEGDAHCVARSRVQQALPVGVFEVVRRQRAFHDRLGPLRPNLGLPTRICSDSGAQAFCSISW